MRRKFFGKIIFSNIRQADVSNNMELDWRGKNISNYPFTAGILNGNTPEK